MAQSSGGVTGYTPPQDQKRTSGPKGPGISAMPTVDEKTVRPGESSPGARIEGRPGSVPAQTEGRPGSSREGSR